MPRSPVANVLSPGRTRAVREAEKLLTTPQHEIIKRRRAVMNLNQPFVIQRRPSDSSRGEGPSRPKGKAWIRGNGPTPVFPMRNLISKPSVLHWSPGRAAQEWARSQSELAHEHAGSRTAAGLSEVPVKVAAASPVTSADESDSELKERKKSAHRSKKGRSKLEEGPNCRPERWLDQSLESYRPSSCFGG